MIESNPLVTVIVRTYSGRGFVLHQCLESILTQTYKNFEVIVVQDGGSDLERYVSELNDTRFNFIGMSKVGRCTSGNKGLSESKGIFINFLDDDDLFYKNHLETCVNKALQHPNYLIFYTNSHECKSLLIRNEQGIITDIKTSEELIEFSKEFNLLELLNTNFLPIQSVFFSRQLIERCGILNPELDNLEDWDLWVRYAAETKFYHIDEFTSMFRTPFNNNESKYRENEINSYYNLALKNQSNLTFKKLTASAIRSYTKKYHQEIEALKKQVTEQLNESKITAQSLQKALSNIQLLVEHSEHQSQIIKNRDRFIIEITQSFSWRVTSPLRLFKRLFLRQSSHQSRTAPKQ